MATHSTIGGFHGRTFQISRENGQKDKTGRPYFFEYIRELPADQAGRKFETRGERHYELFAVIDGILTDITTEEKSFGETKAPENWLVLHLEDGGQQYKIETGSVDGRYSMDIMKRLLSPDFDPAKTLRLSPYSMEKENGGWNIGLSAYSGPDGKLTAAYKDAHLKGMPEPGQSEFKGKTLWDFEPVASWLMEQVAKNVIPNLGGSIAPINTTVTANQSDDFPTEAPTVPPVEADDLPF